MRSSASRLEVQSRRMDARRSRDTWLQTWRAFRLFERGGPELSEGVGPVPFEHTFARIFSHRLSQSVIVNQTRYGRYKVISVMRFRNKTVVFVYNEFLRSADIGHNHW